MIFMILLNEESIEMENLAKDQVTFQYIYEIIDPSVDLDTIHFLSYQLQTAFVPSNVYESENLHYYVIENYMP